VKTIHINTFFYSFSIFDHWQGKAKVTTKSMRIMNIKSSKSVLKYLGYS